MFGLPIAITVFLIERADYGRFNSEMRVGIEIESGVIAIYI